MGNLTAYIILIVAVVLGTAANGFAKSAQGFTLFIPSIITAISIVGCMYALSLVMNTAIQFLFDFLKTSKIFNVPNVFVFQVSKGFS